MTRCTNRTAALCLVGFELLLTFHQQDELYTNLYVFQQELINSRRVTNIIGKTKCPFRMYNGCGCIETKEKLNHFLKYVNRVEIYYQERNI